MCILKKHPGELWVSFPPTQFRTSGCNTDAQDHRESRFFCSRNTFSKPQMCHSVKIKEQKEPWRSHGGTGKNGEQARLVDLRCSTQIFDPRPPNPPSLSLGNTTLPTPDCASSSKGMPTSLILCVISFPRLQASREQDCIFLSTYLVPGTSLAKPRH